MNATESKQMGKIISALEEMRSNIGSFADDLRGLADAQQEKYDKMSEKAQESDRGVAIYDSIDPLNNAADALDEGGIEAALDALGEISLD